MRGLDKYCSVAGPSAAMPGCRDQDSEALLLCCSWSTRRPAWPILQDTQCLDTHSTQTTVCAPLTCHLQGPCLHLLLRVVRHPPCAAQLLLCPHAAGLVKACVTALDRCNDLHPDQHTADSQHARVDGLLQVRVPAWIWLGLIAGDCGCCCLIVLMVDVGCC
jgi:hypothetical protein